MSRLVSGVVLAAGLLTSACGAAPAATEQAGSPPPNKFGPASAGQGGLTAILPMADLSVGREQRFVLGLLDSTNVLIADAAVELSFQKRGSSAQARIESPARPFPYPGTGGGIYVARVTFDEPGDWRMEASVQQPGHSQRSAVAEFTVKAESSTPRIGDSVPRSQTLTGRSAEEIAAFSSAPSINPLLYRLSIAEALQEGKPQAVLFASPGFCASRVCGPGLEMFDDLHRSFAAQMNFIHVEIYRNGRPPDVVPAVREWRLPSEPWLFLVGADGRLWDKYEGGVTAEEVMPRLLELVGSSG